MGPDELRDEFLLDPDVVFLNHGSFGACPRPVFGRYQEWQLERRPVEFLARRLPSLLDDVRARLAAYVGARPDDLVLVRNATSGVKRPRTVAAPPARRRDRRHGSRVRRLRPALAARLRAGRRALRVRGSAV